MRFSELEAKEKFVFSHNIRNIKSKPRQNIAQSKKRITSFVFSSTNLAAYIEFN